MDEFTVTHIMNELEMIKKLLNLHCAQCNKEVSLNESIVCNLCDGRHVFCKDCGFGTCQSCKMSICTTYQSQIVKCDVCGEANVICKKNCNSGLTSFTLCECGIAECGNHKNYTNNLPYILFRQQSKGRFHIMDFWNKCSKCRSSEVQIYMD